MTYEEQLIEARNEQIKQARHYGFITQFTNQIDDSLVKQASDKDAYVAHAYNIYANKDYERMYKFAALHQHLTSN